MLCSTRHFAVADIATLDGTQLPQAGTSEHSEGSIETSRLAGAEAVDLSIDGGPEAMFDEGNSLDLSPIKISHGALTYGHALAVDPEEAEFGSTQSSVDEMLDDTFHHRRKAGHGINKAATAAG